MSQTTNEFYQQQKKSYIKSTVFLLFCNFYNRLALIMMIPLEFLGIELPLSTLLSRLSRLLSLFLFFTQISAWYISDNIFDIPSTTLCRPCEVSCNTGLTCIVGSFLVLRLQLRSRLPSRTNTKIPGGDQGKKRRPTPFADTPTCR